MINKQNYVCQDVDFMQKWVLNGFLGPQQNPSKTAVRLRFGGWGEVMAQPDKCDTIYIGSWGRIR